MAKTNKTLILRSLVNAIKGVFKFSSLSNPATCYFHSFIGYNEIHPSLNVIKSDPTFMALNMCTRKPKPSGTKQT